MDDSGVRCDDTIVSACRMERKKKSEARGLGKLFIKSWEISRDVSLGQGIMSSNIGHRQAGDCVLEQVGGGWPLLVKGNGYDGCDGMVTQWSKVASRDPQKDKGGQSTSN